MWYLARSLESLAPTVREGVRSTPVDVADQVAQLAEFETDLRPAAPEDVERAATDCLSIVAADPSCMRFGPEAGALSFLDGRWVETGFERRAETPAVATCRACAWAARNAIDWVSRPSDSAGSRLRAAVASHRIPLDGPPEW